ncbi:MAG: hypothetical protein RLZZ488_957 [Pseudomonadota bacterium]|jgi:hypothetical protein
MAQVAVGLVMLVQPEQVAQVAELVVPAVALAVVD